MRTQLTDHERELLRHSCIEQMRQDARRKMAVVVVVLLCIGSLAGGLLYYFLTQ